MTRSQRWMALAAWLALSPLGGSVALAQAAEEVPSARTDPDSLTDGEKLQQSTRTIASMRADLTQVLKSLDDARASRDVVKLNCVNEKLTELKGLLRISEQADVALQEAIAARDEVAVRHEFTKLDIAGSRGRSLRSESARCIGQLAFQTDENLMVEVEEPESVFADDPTRPSADVPLTQRAPPASPTQ
ncbi:MAG TPA: hypothetical protein VK013_12550 [Myxococcaceae bacterium]|nr:hypothetical protein [Myxococcaceae bacterium]